jgi:hypothetical protein
MTSAPFDRAELERIAAAYPEDARAVSTWDRERYFTPAQQAAWLLRFEPECCPDLLAVGAGR